MKSEEEYSELQRCWQKLESMIESADASELRKLLFLDGKGNCGPEAEQVFGELESVMELMFKLARSGDKTAILHLVREGEKISGFLKEILEDEVEPFQRATRASPDHPYSIEACSDILGALGKEGKERLLSELKDFVSSYPDSKENPIFIEYDCSCSEKQRLLDEAFLRLVWSRFASMAQEETLEISRTVHWWPTTVSALEWAAPTFLPKEFGKDTAFKLNTPGRGRRSDMGDELGVFLYSIIYSIEKLRHNASLTWAATDHDKKMVGLAEELIIEGLAGDCLSFRTELGFFDDNRLKVSRLLENEEIPSLVEFYKKASSEQKEAWLQILKPYLNFLGWERKAVLLPALDRDSLNDWTEAVMAYCEELCKGDFDVYDWPQTVLDRNRRKTNQSMRTSLREKISQKMKSILAR
ncbi:hypothetical protein AAFN60_13980 [Roseibacillus persicicus]|uniref:hypothetical protein n=1 Tax=Roseibacillus persicicus TaxID=454148 RepID=UPI00398ABB52